MYDGKRYEDFEIGDAYTSPWKTVMEGQFTQYVSTFGVHEPLFEDQAFFREEIGEEPWFVPGYFTISMGLGLFLRSGWFDGTGIALLESNNRFQEPVFVGDDIRVAVEVVDTTETSSDRGGVVEIDWDIEVREGPTAVESTTRSFIKKRDAD